VSVSPQTSEVLVEDWVTLHSERSPETREPASGVETPEVFRLPALASCLDGEPE
jgi:hypothetical protein